MKMFLSIYGTFIDNIGKIFFFKSNAFVFNYQVAFEAIKGSGYESDIAIDAISMNACGEY
jgi:hypothetical protein